MLLPVGIGPCAFTIYERICPMVLFKLSSAYCIYLKFLLYRLITDESSFVTVKRPGAIVANVMFSPVEPMHLLFAGQSGAHVIDMRNTKRFIILHLLFCTQVINS